MKLEEIRIYALLRRKTALTYRQIGMTYKQIGEKLGVCPSRARDIVISAERLFKEDIKFEEKEFDWEYYRFYGMKFTTLKFYCESLAEQEKIYESIHNKLQ